MNRLRERYKKEILPQLLKDFQLSNVMEAPKLKKIVINSGIGSFKSDKGAVESFSEELSLIAGQKVVDRKARLSEAGFKIRKGDVVGLSATLRGEKMWSFLDKFISIALPRVKDFKGLKVNSFDKLGNYSIGIDDHTIFPEVDTNVTKGNRHLQVTFIIGSKSIEKSEGLLRALGMPIRERVKDGKAVTVTKA